jgi:tRNA threonylcarbamoyladenosine biosynthesis protein TsaE
MPNLKHNLPLTIKSPKAMQAFGKKLAQALQKEHCQSSIIYLCGELGSGKTTLVRGFLRAFGYQGKVKSPTFTLLESYQVKTQKIFHFDLYRLNNAEELEYIGIRDYFSSDAIVLIEWPERASSVLPKADLILSLQHDAKNPQQRLVALTAENNKVIPIVSLLA